MRLMLACLTAVLMMQCGIFDPRKSEPPASDTGLDFSEYGNILDELGRIYNSGDAENLTLLLHDDFLFRADSLDSSALGAVHGSWSKTQELLVTEKLFADTAFQAQALAYDESVLFNTSDSAVVRWSYAMARKDSVSVKGTSEFTLVRELSRFYLKTWSDFADSSGANVKSWGRWKMENY
jgi:hypothetical protein